MNIHRMKVGMVKDQKDRCLCYPDAGRDGYYVIASPSEMVKIGDTIEYEPYGVNFGFYIRVVQPDEVTTS